jgi:hypothetical protein
MNDNSKGIFMSDHHPLIESTCAEHASEHFRRASEELLHAYQRNKEASRHHEAGAFKASLHHVKLSTHHAFNAHEHLKQALFITEKMGTMEGGLLTMRGVSQVSPGLQ